MIHQIIFIQPRPGMSDQAAQEYWVNVHAPRFLDGLPAIKAYLVAPTLQDRGKSPAALGMGTAEVWIEDFTQLLGLVGAERFWHARADEPNFTAFWRTLVLLTSDRTIVDGPGPVVPAPAVKVQIVIKRRAGLPLGTFRARCLEDVAAPAAKLPGLLRHVQCQSMDAAYAAGETPLDAALQFWFESPRVASQAMRSVEYAGMIRELLAIAEPRYVHTLVTREQWLIKPDGTRMPTRAEPEHADTGRPADRAADRSADRSGTGRGRRPRLARS